MIIKRKQVSVKAYLKSFDWACLLEKVIIRHQVQKRPSLEDRTHLFRMEQVGAHRKVNTPSSYGVHSFIMHIWSSYCTTVNTSTQCFSAVPVVFGSTVDKTKGTACCFG